MNDMKKLTEAFENDDFGILKRRIAETNRKIKKLSSIVSQLDDSEIIDQF